ncbi:putative acetyl esterase [Azoarcus olearius]|uniref:alpha/beta hydrolase n=1 Tax=Azoarcus sp. (strain BH72) TaxID=418699 RepID=UPI0008063A81|nr:alpha/beta hydrolase [Azoarcus olearius]ANQ85521.1 putative acetyl esterase [Azoarcus olearius]
MNKIVFQGRWSHRLRSLATAGAVAARVATRRLLGRRRVESWSFLFEYGTLYIRAQFNHAFRLKADISVSRAYFDSFYSVFDTYPDVEVRASGAGEPRGHWFIPAVRHSDATLLHFHGGGYTFHAGVSRHFARILAHSLGVVVFAPDYRLTPEHPHPAQLEDGLAAYRYLLGRGVAPRRLVLCGDSAGGHLALMTLSHLARAGLPTPLLTLGISPWTDIGRRGASQFGNDPYDLVQGYMTLQFAEWLKGGQDVSDAELSPIHQDYRGLGPIYLQAGGREILVDMIRDFAATVAEQGGPVRLDVWPDMNHEFHGYGDQLAESRAALDRLRAAIAWAAQPTRPFAADALTECDTLSLATRDARRPPRHGTGGREQEAGGRGVAARPASSVPNS